MCATAVSAPSCYAGAVSCSRLVVVLASLVGCARAQTSPPLEPSPPVDTTPPESPPAPETAPRPFELAPRYAATFEAHYEGCRGPADEHQGSVELLVDSALAATMTVEIRSRDHLREAGIVVRRADGEPMEPWGPTICRFVGAGSKSAEGYTATLRSHEEDSSCGEPSSFELRCRPDSLALPDPRGDEGAIEVLRCTLGTSKPAVLWVLGPTDEIFVADTPLHSRLRRSTMGLDRHELVRGGPPTDAP